MPCRYLAGPSIWTTTDVEQSAAGCELGELPRRQTAAHVELSDLCRIVWEELAVAQPAARSLR